MLILISGNIYRKKMMQNHPEYKYYLNGLVAKITGGIGLAFVYSFYYPGGDTLQYFYDSLAFQKLFFVDFHSFWTVFTNKATSTNFVYFNDETGYPAYCRDPKAWFVVKLALFIVGFSMQSYLTTSIVCAALSFIGVWKLYTVFVSEFPELHKEMAISFLFIPSVFFWGSGLLKDTFTFAALGFFVWGVYNNLISGKNLIRGFVTMIIAGYVIISIKPYILVGLVPAVIVWIVHRLAGRIRGAIMRTAAVPLLIVFGVIFGYGFMVVMGDALQEYKLDTILEKAVVNQKDLKSDYHKGNSFDIGEFEPTVDGIASKFPIATFSAIFRPMIFEVNNVVMFFASIENLVILIFTIRVLFYVRFFRLFKYLGQNHLLFFSFCFSILFAFSVGLSTSNFGSLVRYKIPCIPFFVATLFIIRHLHTKYKKEQDEMKVQVFTLD